MSAGRSMATDLPIPSGTKREVPSLAATLSTGTRASAASDRAGGAKPAATTRAASAATRIEVLMAMSPFPLARSFRIRHRTHAKSDDVDAGAAPAHWVLGLRPVAAGVGDA